MSWGDWRAGRVSRVVGGRLLVLCVVAGTAVLAAASAAVAREVGPIRANLDADTADERVLVESIAGPEGIKRRIVVIDLCNGDNKAHVLSGLYDRVQTLAATDVDGRAVQPELVLALSSGRDRREGEVRIVRFDGPATGCSQPRVLFSYVTLRPPRRPPRGQIVMGVRVEVRDITPRYRGKEIQLTEGWAPRARRPKATSWHYSYFRLNGTRYVRYRLKTVDVGGS